MADKVDASTIKPPPVTAAAPLDVTNKIAIIVNC
ncbi:Uncharacterised protein [Streptococcus pneumoniae]|nr:Uncharacterised protein [Streptococcus pneumoniae]